MQYQILLLLHLFSFSGASESSIVNGKVSKPHSRPYMVSLQENGCHKCGGLLVRQDFVLTSAHCKRKDLTVVLGAHDIRKNEKSQQRIQVEKYHVHPNYTDGYAYDIMLLKLKTNAILNRYVKTVGLPKKDGKIPANINCVVAGWGKQEPNGLASDVLRETQVKTQFGHECKFKWGIYFHIEQMICSQTSGKNGGICQGDSGGPLLCKTKLLGISAFTAMKCDDLKYPNVFMKIPFFMPWVKRVMQ